MWKGFKFLWEGGQVCAAIMLGQGWSTEMRKPIHTTWKFKNVSESVEVNEELYPYAHEEKKMHLKIVPQKQVTEVWDNVLMVLLAGRTPVFYSGKMFFKNNKSVVT